MKHNRYLLDFALLVAGALPIFSQVSNDNEDEVHKIDVRTSKHEYVPGQVLVKFKDADRIQVNAARGMFRSTSNNRLTQVLQKFGAEEMEQLLPNENPKRTIRRAKAFNGDIIQERDLSQLYRVKLSAPHAHETMQLVDELKQVDEVEFTEPNYILHILENSNIAASFGGNPYATSQWYLADYGVTQLWNKPIINPTRPVIAILDTGVDMTHPDLAPNLWTNPAEANGEPNYDNDNNGFAGDIHGWDFVNNTSNVRDYNMHGTHVAGIAAAANNGIGIVGANPMALIMPITVMQSDGSGDVATIIKGINYAVSNGASVLNLSLGTYANSRALRQALENAYQKAVIVAAAGNDGLGIYPECGAIIYKPMFPAAYSFVLGVQATNQGGGLAGFSNFDCDGPAYSAESFIQDPDGFNYELKAPGTNMLSTIPGGKYKVLQGTSMAAPLVAGAISALKMVKQYDTQEILWGDLLHTDNIAQAYAVTNRPAELDLMKIMYRERKELTDETEEDYGGDGEIDAGETVSLYPVIRTTFGAASNIQMKLEMGDEFEDPNTVEILTPGWVNFGLPLSTYGKGVSLNPMQLKVASNVADNRHIKMKFTAKCDETNTQYVGTFTLIITNMVKLNGLISEDRTLTADHIYYVNENLAVMDGVTLTIEPGTRIEFAENIGLSCYGNLIANGVPGKMIYFTGHKDEKPWGGINSANTTVSYCKFENYFISYERPEEIKQPTINDCIIIPYKGGNYYHNLFEPLKGERNNIMMANGRYIYGNINRELTHSNIVNNFWGDWDVPSTMPSYSQLIENNYFNNATQLTLNGGKHQDKYYSLAINSISPIIDHSDYPSYLGTSREDIIRPYIYEIGNAPNTYGQIDLSNMRITPVAEAHGIVWKVLVNGKDAQDEYEDLAPLGVGKHKFEVYFNRPMNKAVVPQISFGVRDPWTQNAVNEEGSWNAEGTIYTVYKTITGKTKSDGVNRIYVYGAEDNEFFECPYEKTRFNVMINAAGSMATGFAAEAGLGRVELTWDNTHNDFEDAMGFNIYRFGEPYEKRVYNPHYDDEGNLQEYEIIMVSDTIRLNQEVLDIETEAYTDYAVTPGETYYYMYKVLSTDLKEYDVSNVVAATPLTSTKGDADGSGEVDVNDVVATVNYVVGVDQKPFIFEAADMNSDLAIDVLDVIGIVQKIMTTPSRVFIESAPEAVYTIEDGVLYVESPVTLAGLQVQLSTDEEPVSADDMKGFELASAWLTDSDYRLLAYSFGSKVLEPGKHAIMKVGGAELTSLRLSDTQGHRVNVVAGETTAVKDAMGSKVMNTKGVYNLNGQKVTGNSDSKLRKGVYIINGEKVIK